MAIRDALLLLGVRLLVCASAMEHSAGEISGWASNPNYSSTSVSGEIFRTEFAPKKSVVVMGILVLICSSVIAYMCIRKDFLTSKETNVRPLDELVKKDIEVRPTVGPAKDIEAAQGFSPAPLFRSNEKSDITLLRATVPVHARNFDHQGVPEDKDGPLFTTNENSDTLFSVPVNARASYSYTYAVSEENGEPLFRSNEKSDTLPSVPLDARNFGSYHNVVLEEKDDPLFRTNDKSDTRLNSGAPESGYPSDKKQVIPIKIPRVFYTLVDKAMDSGVQKVVAIGVDKVKEGMDKVKEKAQPGARKMKEGVESGVPESGDPSDKKQVIPIKMPQIFDSGVQKVVAIGVDKVKQGMDKVKEEAQWGARKMKQGVESGVHKFTGSGEKK